MLFLPVVILLLGVGTALLTPATQVVGDALVAFGSAFMYTWFDFSHLHAPAPAPAPTGPEPVTSLSIYRPFVLPPPPPPPTKLPFFSPTAVLRYIRPAPLASARLVIRDTPTGYVPVPAAYAHGPYEIPQFSTCVLHALEQAAPLILLALVSALVFRLAIIQRFTSFELRNAKECASSSTDADLDASALSMQDTSSDESVDTLVAETPEVFTIVEEEQPAAQVFIDQVISSNPASPVTSPVQKPVDLMQTPEQATDAENTVPVVIPEYSLDNVEQAPEDVEQAPEDVEQAPKDDDDDEPFRYPGADNADMNADTTAINASTSSSNANISGITADTADNIADAADNADISIDTADTTADVQSSSSSAAEDYVPACTSLTGPPIPNIGVDDNVPARDSVLVDDNFPASDSTLTVGAEDNVPAHDSWEEPATASVSVPVYVSAPASASRSAPATPLNLPTRSASVPPRSIPMPDDSNDDDDDDDDQTCTPVPHARQNTARPSSTMSEMCASASGCSADTHISDIVLTDSAQDDLTSTLVAAAVAATDNFTITATDDTAIDVADDVPAAVADDATALITEDQSAAGPSNAEAPTSDTVPTNTVPMATGENEGDEPFIYPTDPQTPSDSTAADLPAQEEARSDTTIAALDLAIFVRRPEVEMTDSASECSAAAPVDTASERATDDTDKDNGTSTVVMIQQDAKRPESPNPAQRLAARGSTIYDLIHASKPKPEQPEAGPSTRAPEQQPPKPGFGINDSIWAHDNQRPKQPRHQPHAPKPQPKQPKAGPSTYALRQQLPKEDRSIYGSRYARPQGPAPQGHFAGMDTGAGHSMVAPWQPFVLQPRAANKPQRRGKGKAR